MKNKSIWSNDFEKSNLKKLEENQKVDVLIIGGGLTGLSLLAELKETNLKTILVEKNKIGSGVSSKMTGKASFLQGIVYSKIKKDVNHESAKLYLESQLDGLKILKERIAKEKIDCNFEKVTSYYISENTKELQEEYEFFRENNVFIAKDKNYLKTDDTYTINPVKYLNHLKNKMQDFIYENTNVIEIEKEKNNYIAYTKDFKIEAKIIVLACHYPFKLFPFFLPFRTYEEKSSIYAKVVKEDKKEALLMENQISKRYYRDKKIYEIILTKSRPIYNSKNIIKELKEKLQDESVEYIWSNEDIMTADHIPFIGKISPNLLLATGYNTWGLLNSSIASLVLKDIILNKPNKYISLFDPKRNFNLAKLKQYPMNMFYNLESFIESKVFLKKDWYPENLEFTKEKGKKIAIYHEGENTYKVIPKCPHMGCSLIFNEIEKTWDCPCHASRFDKTGVCIKGPSKWNISFK